MNIQASPNSPLVTSLMEDDQEIPLLTPSSSSQQGEDDMGLTLRRFPGRCPAHVQMDVRIFNCVTALSDRREEAHSFVDEQNSSGDVTLGVADAARSRTTRNSITALDISSRISYSKGLSQLKRSSPSRGFVRKV